MTSPFDWKGKPSVVASDKKFKPLKNGKTRSQTSTEGLQKVYARGVNSGTVLGLSKDQDLGYQTEMFNKIHRRKK